MLTLECYDAILQLSREDRGKNPEPGTRNLKKVLDSNTSKCYNRVKKTENRTPVSEQKKSLLYETWTSNAGTVQRFSNLTTTLQSVTIKAQNNIKR